jgi:uncharacterized protein YdeI (YjbR/CyaY-like superfamily)
MQQHQIDPAVDAFIGRSKQWRAETEALRGILLDCGLAESLKWGKPCYAAEGKNIVLIQGFKEYFALLFFKGVLLKDPKQLLVKMGENTEVGRQMRFPDVATIMKQAPVLKAYIKEAIAIEKAGLSAKSTKPKALAMPEEFKQVLDADAQLKAAFTALTPGRQNAYLIHFAAAKQAKTRQARIEKYLPQILAGKGLND